MQDLGGGQGELDGGVGEGALEGATRTDDRDSATIKGQLDSLRDVDLFNGRDDLHETKQMDGRC